jgi:electron transfer flavoprotein-quinone oxidoreductase
MPDKGEGMNPSNFEIVVVGAGAAGLTAAIGLARAGFSVAVLEAASFPGAENWSGCVYFCENLAHPDILGPDGVEVLAWERRLVERGLFATDGHGLLGMTYRDPEAFRHCYTVLRPLYDHHLAQIAVQHGVAVLSATTVESLIRQENRIIGVSTNRGPLYAQLVFLAEGDASHLVTREGYERSTDQRDAPKFLQGIKQVLELPPGAIEDRFHVGADQGVAYEMLLRNGTLQGRPVRLNMGGFLYTNRQSLSIGLVLPADNLAHEFGGDPNLLLEWFEELPALRPWLRDGKRGAFGAKLIRGGGVKDIPTLIDDGLAIGGAASAIGIDFPYPNFTGPATAMGLLLVQAACAIRRAGGQFTRDNLRRHYLEPLRRSHYWQDVEFLRRWPGYVKRTRHFFGRNLDLTLGSAYVWTRSDRSLPGRWTAWLRLLLRVGGPEHWPELQADGRHLSAALRLQTVLPRPALGRLLLDGTVNAFRDLLHRPRRDLPSAGQVHLHYAVAGQPSGRPPLLARRWFGRFAPVLASAARLIYANDATPLAAKLPAALRLLIKQINLVDLIGLAILWLAAAAGGSVLVGWDRFLELFRRKKLPEDQKRYAGLYGGYTQAARQATDLTPRLAPAAANWEERLAQLQCEPVRASHIHVLWPRAIQDKNAVVEAGLWHVCPAHVYEARTDAGGQVQVIVNFENCIKCETCWRTSDLADWGRDGLHRFVYAVHSPAVDKLLDAQEAAGRVAPKPPLAIRHWNKQGTPAPEKTAAVSMLLHQLTRKLEEYDEALAEEPRTVDRGRAEYLELLARYAHQLAVRLEEVLQRSPYAANPEIRNLAKELAARAEKRARQVWQQRLAWAAAEGRQLRQHHLAGLRHYLGAGAARGFARAGTWLRSEQVKDALAQWLCTWRQRLDEVLPATLWRDLENQQPLTSDQDAVVRAFLAEIPALDPANFATTLHPPVRKLVLAELGRRDPSLAYRAASHLWARDLAHLAGLSSEVTDRLRLVDEWACLAPILPNTSEALLVPARDALVVLVLAGDMVEVFRKDNTGKAPGIAIEPLRTLALRGAGMARVLISTPQATRTGQLELAYQLLSSADLIAIALGMADLLCERTVAHAAGRVQFPGLFHDEDARDSIGKFGAVKKMVADLAARRYLIETLVYNLSPADLFLVSNGVATCVKATVAELLGTAPTTMTYDAGQVFGGTGYSEDDILSKYFRDAAAWQFLGAANVQVFLNMGRQVLDSPEEGEAITRLPEEAPLFAEIAQRKALQAELDEIRTHRARIGAILSEWEQPGGSGGELARAEVLEALGRQEAYHLASRALLLRTHARLEAGLTSEAELALLRAWLESAAGALERFHGAVHLWLRRPEGHEDRPMVDPAAGPPVTIYQDFLQAKSPYNSGDFLDRPTDLLQPRLVPEMIAQDPALAAICRHFRELLQQQFEGLRDGLPYERYLEKQHRPDAADLEFCRRHGFFRMPIPKELGGAGSSKLAYYLLTTNTNRIADVCLSLTIQVNSSLGTTPVLLARGKDLPKAEAAAKEKGARATELVDELGRRREAADLFLRWVAAGQISGFALTEPSAGSDTARVATRARLRSVTVEAGDDGVFQFIPVGGKEVRTLLDARGLEFRAASGELQAFYRWSEHAEPALIRFDEYDYETDDPRRMRYFEYDGRRVYFTDIAQLRSRDGGLWYDYWELNGAKMWITNGRIAGIFCLYAKTEQGVTGFIVDRHAEGLVVGKDEAKMGQCGSPTNELSLQSVRVPRENVIGLEGRGQVNALETLNVGRAGLAMSAMAYMADLIDSARAFARQVHGEIPAWAAWRLERMEEERFIAEALAFEVIGRFEHKDTKSVRLESAAAKMLVSELYQHLIETAEEIYGLPGQTEEHLVEKRKRDARVLNIYEGTNEVQRFLILKDLAAEVAPRWQPHLPGATGYLGPEALELETLKAEVRTRTRAALETFGQQLWQNPNLQANCFLLAEAVAWLAATESTLGRVAWLSRLEMAEENREPAASLVLGRRAVRRCQVETRERLKRFDEELTHLRRGYYAPQIRAAALLFRQLAQPARRRPLTSVVNKPLAILVVIDSLAPGVPHPQVAQGRLKEPYRVWSAADRSALEAALRLRDSADPASAVRIELVVVESSSAAVVLRQALSLGVDRAVLITPESGPIAPDRAAMAIMAVVGNEFDLILGGGLEGQEGVLLRLVAAALGKPFAGKAAQVAVRMSQDEQSLLLTEADGEQRRRRELPAAIAVEAGLALRDFTIQGWLAALATPIEVEPWPAGLSAGKPVIFEEGRAGESASSEDTTHVLSPREAGRLVLEKIGLRAKNQPGQNGTDHTVSDNGAALVIETVPQPMFLASQGAGILAVLGTEAAGQLTPAADPVLSAARLLAQRCGRSSPLFVLLLSTAGPEEERHAARQIVALAAPAGVTIFPIDASMTGDALRNRILTECLHGMPFASFVGEAWTEGAAASLALAQLPTLVAMNVHRLTGADKGTVLETPLVHGKLLARQTLPDGHGAWITLAPDAVVAGETATPERRTPRIERWQPRLETLYRQADMRQLLEEVKQAAGVERLADAEFILDVGFGVQNRDGYELVIEPLECVLRELGVRGLMAGGSRKVTEELHLLPADRQIGQSGVSVNPRVLLAIGVSGAPQHLNYIGGRAIIVAFNRDPEAPIMTLNQRQKQPRVFPVVGDLFETVPALTAALQERQ